MTFNTSDQITKNYTHQSFYQLQHNDTLHNYTLRQVVEHHAYASIIIDRSITPIWYIIGFIGNFISIAVWLQKRLRQNSSSAVYFAALSISDVCMLLLQMVYELDTVWYFNTLGYPVICESFAVFFLLGQYLAPIFVFCFTIDRYIAICFPFKKNKYCTPRQALKVVLLVVFLSILLCSMQAYFWHYDSFNKVCTLRLYYINNSTGTLWFNWTTVTESLIFFVIPLFNLIVNVRVIHEIYKISKKQQSTTNIVARPRTASQQPVDASKPQFMSSIRSKHHLSNPHMFQQRSSLLGKLTPGSKSSLFATSGRSLNASSARNSYSASHPSHHHHAAVATNVMLLTVSFYVIFTTLPAAIIYVLENTYQEGNLINTNHYIIAKDPTWRRYFTFITIKSIIYEICTSHYACNVFIFIFTGSKFRNAVLSTFCCREKTSDVDNYYGNSNFNNNNNNYSFNSSHMNEGRRQSHPNRTRKT